MNSTQQITTEKEIETSLVRLLRPIAPEADFEVLDPTVNLQETLDIDSFDFLNFLIGLEEATGVSVPEADYDQLVSLKDIVNYVAERMN